MTNNNNPDLHYLKGDALEAIGKIQAAAIEYRAAIALNPTENVRQYCERALGAMPVGMADSPMPAQGTIAYNASLAIYNDMNKQAKVHRLYGETEELGLGEEDMIAVIRAIEHRSLNC